VPSNVFTVTDIGAYSVFMLFNVTFFRPCVNTSIMFVYFGDD